jgi:PAS domain S-box-containing protein
MLGPAMRFCLWLDLDGRVVSTTFGVEQVHPALAAGARVSELAGLTALDALRVLALQQRAARDHVVLNGAGWDVLVEASATGCFVTLTAPVAEVPSAARTGLEILDLLSSGKPLSELLDEVCRACEASIPLSVCSVLLVGDDGLLHQGGGPNLPTALREAGEGLAPGPNRGSCGTAVWLKQPVLVADALIDPIWEGFRPLMRSIGRRSAWSWPIVNNDDVVIGSLAAYGVVARLPTDAEQDSMKTLGRLAALAIEKWRNERSTRDALERFHLAAEASTNVIYDWNLRNNHLEWSPRMETVFGHPTAALRTFEWWESSIHPAERERVTRGLVSALSERRATWTDSYRFRRGDGSYAAVSDRGRLLFDAFGAPVRLIGEMSDVSRQQELQARLALTERLASVGTLAAGVAHEINNPLAWITSNLHYALEELDKLRVAPQPALVDEVSEALTDARTGAERVGVIVRDLKMFSRAQDDQSGVLESSITMARNEIRHRALLERRFDDVPLVKGNEGRLSQVFLNLLINAAHALPEGDVTHQRIVVSTSLDSHGHVVVTVRDTGQGIAADVLPHIFDPFFTTKPVGQGTGLGLSICHSLVTALGGSIEVESQQGRGSTFRVLLPAAPPEFRRTPVPQAERLPVPRGLVALIDDEPSVLFALQRVLGPHHDVRSFTEPRAALEALPGLKPDVIFCDVMMPDMSGAEVYHRLQASHPVLAARLVFMTGGAFSSTAREFLDEVQRPVLDKPFTADGVRRLANEQVALARTLA